MGHASYLHICATHWMVLGDWDWADRLTISDVAVNKNNRSEPSIIIIIYMMYGHVQSIKVDIHNMKLNLYLCRIIYC